MFLTKFDQKIPVQKRLNEHYHQTQHIGISLGTTFHRNQTMDGAGF